MADSAPYAELIGAVTIYVAVAGTAPPTVGQAPSASWVLYGCTTGDQTIEETGPLIYHYDNCGQAPTKAVRPQEDTMVKFTIKDSTLENLARARSQTVGDIVTSGTTKTLPITKGFVPTEYALLMVGDADSPYGAFPGYNYFPRGVFEGEITQTRSKAARSEIAVSYHVIEDRTQAAGFEQGWAAVQTS